MGRDNIPTPDDSTVYGFTGTGAARIAETVKRIEGTYLNQRDRRGRWPVGGGGGTGLIPVTIGSGGAAAGSPTYPTGCTVTYLKPASTGAGFVTGGTGGAYNCYGQVIPAGAFAWVATLHGNNYIVVADC
jgi:hypothetical protein